MFELSTRTGLLWFFQGLSWISLAIGLLGGFYFFWRKAKEEHFELMEAFDGMITALLIGVVFSRIGYIVTHFSEFGWDLWSWIDIQAFPGLWSMVGLLALFLWLARWAQQSKLDSWEVWDFASLLLAWYFSWYWLSLFLSGGAAGKPTSLPWGVVFPHRVEAAHPVQLYALVVFVGLFSYLWWVEPRYRFFLWYRSKKRTAKTGFLFSIFCIISGLLGFALSFVQYPFLLLWDIDLNQMLSALLFFLGCGLLYVRSGRTFFVKKERSTYATFENRSN